MTTMVGVPIPEKEREVLKGVGNSYHKKERVAHTEEVATSVDEMNRVFVNRIGIAMNHASKRISSKWEVVQILTEEEQQPTTVNVYAAKIDQKCASALIRRLSTEAPLKSLGHVKRIRRSMKEGSLELSIVLCTSDQDETSDTFDLPVSIAEIVNDFNLQLFKATVAEHPARSREEWETQCELWPTSFHPNSGRPTESSDLIEGAADTMCAFMKKAIEQAKLARENGQLANGAVIVDPALGTVVATGYDRSGGWNSTRSPCNGPYSLRVPQEEAYSCVSDASPCNPLRHAVIEAIGMAADRERRLWPGEGGQATNGDNRATNSVALATQKRLRDADNTYGGQTTGSSPSSCDSDPPVGTSSSFEIARPYLCTDWDLYVTREPCAMCAMAMVHQRVRRVIYGIPNPYVGALGGQFKLHALPSLNHHYSVFRVALREEDLL